MSLQIRTISEFFYLKEDKIFWKISENEIQEFFLVLKKR